MRTSLLHPNLMCHHNTLVFTMHACTLAIATTQRSIVRNIYYDEYAAWIVKSPVAIIIRKVGGYFCTQNT